MTYKIGVDGGGTKTECVLVDAAGVIVARHLAPGCNPNIVGPEQARLILTDALGALTSALGAQLSTLSSSPIVATQLFMSGLPGFWSEVAASLKDLGHVTAALDSLPILELATHGAPGLVIHAGTGSFVAARAPDGTIHYAGGTGWRFGDPGSGYELGRRAISRALLELQGWLPASRLGPTVRDHTQLGDAADMVLMMMGDQDIRQGPALALQGGDDGTGFRRVDGQGGQRGHGSRSSALRRPGGSESPAPWAARAPPARRSGGAPTSSRRRC